MCDGINISLKLEYFIHRTFVYPTSASELYAAAFTTSKEPALQKQALDKIKITRQIAAK